MDPQQPRAAGAPRIPEQDPPDSSARGGNCNDLALNHHLHLRKSQGFSRRARKAVFAGHYITAEKQWKARKEKGRLKIC
jgi:hypothetical protein